MQLARHIGLKNRDIRNAMGPNPIAATTFDKLIFGTVVQRRDTEVSKTSTHAVNIASSNLVGATIYGRIRKMAKRQYLGYCDFYRFDSYYAHYLYQ